jgi:hypothetical protein
VLYKLTFTVEFTFTITIQPDVSQWKGDTAVIVKGYWHRVYSAFFIFLSPVEPSILVDHTVAIVQRHDHPKLIDMVLD